MAALRTTEKGYRVAVLKAGKRWPDADIAKTSWDVRTFLWQPEIEMLGIQRMELLDDVLVLCGAGVGGGSHVYGNTLYVPPKKFFDAPGWAGDRRTQPRPARLRDTTAAPAADPV